MSVINLGVMIKCQVLKRDVSAEEGIMDLIVVFPQALGRVTLKTITTELNSNLGNSLEDSFTASK